MVSLMVKKMKHQARIALVSGNPFGVVVAENGIQSTIGQFTEPDGVANNEVVEDAQNGAKEDPAFFR